MENIKSQKNGFTLIELLVVIAVISLLSTFVIIGVDIARRKSRDTKRVADMKQLKTVFNLFFNDNDRFPNSADDGVSSSGEVIGDNNGPIETALAPYMSIVPGDPLWDGGTSDDDFYYAYDPSHATCNFVISINRFETQAALDDYGGRDTSSGTDMNIDTAHYNYCYVF
ncbi:type II secretion system protein [Patescibacteria group bacterium]